MIGILSDPFAPPWYISSDEGTLSMAIEPPEDDEPSERVVPLISHVNGGPETCTGFCAARPTVRRTVPKSHRSSGSEPPFLYERKDRRTLV